MTRIAVIGTGRVGALLGRRWAAAGHSVVFGSRRTDGPEVRDPPAEAGPAVDVASPPEAAAGAEVIVLAVPGAAALEVAQGLGDLSGRIVVDCTNPVRRGGSAPGRASTDAPSGGEALARALPGARVVKAFNTTGSGNMADPRYPSGNLPMFLCGDDPEARQVVAGLAADLGFEPVDCGGLDAAALLESMALLWIRLAYRQGMGPDFALGLLRRSPTS